MKSKNYYIAIIGDLVESRELENRESIQNDLLKTLENLNNSNYKATIQSKFVITVGDEFQGLVSRDFPISKFFNQYHSLFGDAYETRFGIGLGELSTNLKTEAVGMDGPCFHNARSAVLQAKKDNKKVIFNGFEMTLALNALFQLCDGIKGNWLKRQKQVISLYTEFENQVTVAKKLDITKQSVNDILKASKYELYKFGWSGIQQIFTFNITANRSARNA